MAGPMTTERSVTGASPRVRRTQEERRQATRHRLLEAALDVLADLGHARFTTTEVCQRAGLSQGALFKHFPTKSELMAAAAEHLFALLREDYRRVFASAAADEGQIQKACELLWRAFRSPHAQAAFELYVAARTDDELSRAIGPVIVAHRRHVIDVARALFPRQRENPFFDQHIRLVHDAMQGAAIGAGAARDPETRDMLRYLVGLTRALEGQLIPGLDSPDLASPR